MNVEIGAEAALFPEKEYINGIAFAVQWFALVGEGYVNGRKGLVINIKTCSGQEDPLSSILFLFATEPLNLSNAQNNRNFIQHWRRNRRGPILFADGNLNPLHLSIADDLRLLLATIQQIPASQWP